MAAYPVPPFQPGARQMRGTSGPSPWHWAPLGEWGWAKAMTGPMCRSDSVVPMAGRLGLLGTQIGRLWFHWGSSSGLKWGLGPRAGWGTVVGFVARF